MNRPSHYRRNRLYRSRDERILMGVCGGLAEHFGISPWAVRLIFIVLMIISNVGFPVMVILYFVFGLMLKKAPLRPFNSNEHEEFWNVYQTSRSD